MLSNTQVDHHEWREVTLLFLAVLSGLLLIHSGAITNSDGDSVYAVTKAIATDASFSVPERLGIPGRNGEYFSRYGLGLSLVSLPLFAVGSLLQKLQGPGDDITRAIVSFGIPMVCAFMIVGVYVLSRQLGGSHRDAVTVAVGSLLGTFLLPYTKDFFSEPLTALGILIAIIGALGQGPILAGTGAGLAAVTRPQMIAFIPPLLWRVWRDQGHLGLCRLIIPLVPCGIIIAGYNIARFSDPFNFGYPDGGFTSPFLQGGAKLLGSPTKSLFLFAPVMLLLPFGLIHLWRVRKPGFWLVTWNLGLLFIISAKWVSPEGGWSWGPRLLIPAIPAAAASLALWMGKSRRRKQLTLGMFTAGFLISFPAIIVPTQAQQLDLPPRNSPSVIRQYELLEPTLNRSLSDPYHRERGSGAHRLYLSFWQLAVVNVFGKKGVAIAFLVSFLLAGVVVVMLARVVRIRRMWKTPG